MNDADPAAIIPPIISFELPHGPLHATFDDAGAAGRSVESYDAAETGAFDSRGLRLVITPLPNDTTLFEATSPPVVEPAELKRLILYSLELWRIEHDPDASLDELVAFVHERFRGEPLPTLRESIATALSRLFRRGSQEERRA